MPETALIIGCGYLGRVVARRWLARGLRVHALTRSKADELTALGVTPIMGDVTDPATLSFPAADRILYAVGMDRSAGKSMRDVYLGGLENVLNRLPPGGAFAYVSSTSVYGQADGEWVNELSLTEPTEDSGNLLLACESLLHARRPDAMILRFAGIYGPGRVIRRAAVERGEPLAADPEKWLNLIHVHDGAAVIETVTGRPDAGGVYNVSDGTPVTRRDFYTRMAELLGAPPAAFTAPADGGRDATDRRVANKKLRAAYAPEFAFPSFEAGLRAAITPPG